MLTEPILSKLRIWHHLSLVRDKKKNVSVPRIHIIVGYAQHTHTHKGRHVKSQSKMLDEGEKKKILDEVHPNNGILFNVRKK